MKIYKERTSIIDILEPFLEGLGVLKTMEHLKKSRSYAFKRAANFILSLDISERNITWYDTIEEIYFIVNDCSYKYTVTLSLDFVKIEAEKLEGVEDGNNKVY